MDEENRPLKLESCSVEINDLDPEEDTSNGPRLKTGSVLKKKLAFMASDHPSNRLSSQFYQVVRYRAQSTEFYANASVPRNLNLQLVTDKILDQSEDTNRKEGPDLSDDQVAKHAGCPVNEQATNSTVKQGDAELMPPMRGIREIMRQSYPCDHEAESEVGHDIADRVAYGPPGSSLLKGRVS